MPSFIVTLIVTAVSMLITAQILPGIQINGALPSLIGAGVFGIINSIVRPILVFFTLPFTIVTLGLFLFVVNAICFSLVGYFTPGFAVNSFFDALFGSIIVSVISSFLSNLLDK